MGLDRLGILFIVIVLPIALVLNTYTNTQVDTLKMQLDYDSKLNACTADAVRTYQSNSLSEDFSNLGDVRIGNINASINVFFTSLASNLNMSGYNRQFLQEYVPAIVFTMYDGYYIYSKYTNTLDEGDYKADDVRSTDGSIQKYASTYKNGQQLYGLKPFVHYSCRYVKGSDYDFVVSYTLDNYITIQGIVNGVPVDKSGYLIDVDNNKWFNIRYDSTTQKATVSGTLKYKGIDIGNEPILTDNLVLEKENGSQPETKSYPYHKVNGVKYYWDGEYWFTMQNGRPNKSYYDFQSLGGTSYDNSAYNYYVKAYEFSSWVKENLSGITDEHAKVDYDVLDIDGTEKTIQGLTQTGKEIFNMDGIEEPGSNFNEHRRAVIRYTIERNLSIAIANYNYYSGTQGLDFRMPKFSEAEWDRIQQNMTVISYLQGLPIGTKIYNGVSVIPNNENEEVVSEQSIYIGEKKAGEDNYYYSVLTTLDNFTDPNEEEEFVGIYNVDLRRKEVEYNKQKYYYYPKLYFEKRATVVDIDAEKTDSSKNIYAYNGNIYKYIDEVLLGTSPDPRTTKYKLAQAFYTALGRERESRYNQRNNYEELLTMMSDEEAELVDFNAQFMESTYKGENKTAEEVQKIINIVLDNNNRETDPNRRVVVRQGGGPNTNNSDYYENGNTSGNIISNKCVEDLDAWTTDNTINNYVVATMGTSNTANGYKGDLSVTSNKKYKIKYYYYQGRIKVIYVSKPY
ncbi:MAG: hypothetical protein IJJ82_01065 [Clostridia bacterium]|nr:hypothetical protein [Clostridia bacterium]